MNEATLYVKAEVIGNTVNGGGGGVMSYDMVLRAMAFCFSLLAAVVAALDHQTHTIPVTLSDNLPPFTISITAKWHYLSSTVFLVVANSIACAYSVGSMILSMNKKIQTQLTFLISDLIMVALLFSANRAATSVGIISLKGNSHTQWHKVCYIFKRYCHQGAASIAMSFLGSFAFLWLVVFATLNFHRKSS